MLNTLPCNVGEWRLTEALSEGPEEVPHTQSCDTSEVTDPDGRADVG
jgi:hypothetical protein